MIIFRICLRNNFRILPQWVPREANAIADHYSEFNSKHFCPGTSGVYAFTDEWNNGNNWICPPVSHLGSVFRHLRRCDARATVILPVWQSAYFWPLLYPDGVRLAPFVKDVYVLQPHCVSGGNNQVFVGQPKFRTRALSKQKTGTEAEDGHRSKQKTGTDPSRRRAQIQAEDGHRSKQKTGTDPSRRRAQIQYPVDGHIFR